MLTQMNSYHNKKAKISIENVSKTYKDVDVLKDISIDVYEGEFVSILGPSGCGKSTIFNIITQLTDYNSGMVNINGNYSYMYQKDLLLPYKTIIDNVSLPLVLKKEKKGKARSMVKHYFEVFGLEGYEYKYPAELSGGMRQRANFLRTFINSNDIMLLDEPFGALDSLTKTSMQKWLLDVKKKVNSTILLITHDIDEAIMLSNRIYVISKKPSIVKKEFIIDNRNINEDNLENVIKLKKEIISLL
ncbi:MULTISPECIES: ABC transporter ATP-binding protein [unclassified Clostridioides]|uniref:ABC transporter ATP-binding protein n=1 Tax=unclassified Clostridioides TaxID=2635829 RepID=UPI001D12910B|nr:ABC transporter ATP-binding protein [Clostridioides sp. ZZV15-6388]MCC0643288.1 ABC transporter ATP-binding protein [Clostridioides sp. ZZV14-6150]MCC0658880.1 ABC transporter ATP-binding protein [Clostridioides sp. ZZV14-6154]MCC0664506.1 ABC transporter ATP-binding protein [Clostridioides sp. ZZV15-6597]MCC0667731.1 ABC transporter ATP-binding protein [Clostridioides sp. ZZV14-6153]MCC0718964.1 ABC transporter ATP-binding protein [Clostridioides sp. ZZV14-6105]MCC0721880.1 ABC transporte